MAKQPEGFMKMAELLKLFETPDGKMQLTAEYVSTLVKKGKLPAYRFGEKGHLLFRLSEVEDALRVQVQKEEREEAP